MTTALHFETLVIDYPESTDILNDAERAAAVCSQLVRVSMDFAAIERVPRYCEEKRENNAEHSFMLSLVATELAQQFRPELNVGLVALFSLVHDLPELSTGDIATLDLSETALSQKERAEAEATHALAKTLPPFIGGLLVRYEAQQEPEARHVRLTDKILPVKVDTLGPGKKVMSEDYHVYNEEQLAAVEHRLSKRLRKTFPDPDLQTLHGARDLLAQEFADTFAAS